MVSQASTEALLTEGEAAPLLSLSVACLQAWRQRGEGPPFVRLGRVVRYRRSDLDMWLAASTIRPGPSHALKVVAGALAAALAVPNA